MKRQLKKSLIYLIMTMLVMPTWLVTGMMNAQHAKAASAGDILITEFMADPASVSDSMGEWVEVKNTSLVSQNLQDWKINDAIININHQMPVGSSAVICKVADMALNGGVRCDYESPSLSLVQSPGLYDIILSDNATPTRNIINSVAYDSGDIQPGKSRYLDSSFFWVSETVNQYGSGDFGTPASNTITLSSIAITTPANKLDYIVGDSTLDITGMVVTGTYSDTTTHRLLVTISDITGFESSVFVLGQELTITCDGKTTTYKINILEESQQLLVVPEIIVSGDTADIYVPADIADDATVTVPVDVNAATLNLSDFLIDPSDNSVVLTHQITIIKQTSTGDVIFVIPAGTITGLTGGKFSLPSIQELSIPIPGSLTSTVSAIGIGYTDQSIKFENPVKITFAGQTRNLIGFAGPDNVFKPINNSCTYEVDGVTLKVASDFDSCKVTDITDPVIWTNHFTIFATYTETKVVAPTFTVTPMTINGVNYAKVEWQGNGSAVYEINIGGVIAATVEGSATDTNVTYVKNIKINAYGTFNVSIIATKNGVKSIDNIVKTIKFTAPVKTVEPAPAPVTTSLAPQSAKAAEPAVTNANTNDDQGVIKGDDTANTETEKTNWTPWIVLFVLIILAGAATGGYFYWFAGEDEVATVVKQPRKEEISQKVVSSEKAKQNNNKPNKKSKRW